MDSSGAPSELESVLVASAPNDPERLIEWLAELINVVGFITTTKILSDKSDSVSSLKLTLNSLHSQIPRVEMLTRLGLDVEPEVDEDSGPLGREAILSLGDIAFKLWKQPLDEPVEIEYVGKDDHTFADLMQMGILTDSVCMLILAWEAKDQ